MDEDVDPVIQEIPVYVSQTLAKQLYVFQYPVRPANCGWEDTHVVNCKIKPVHQQVKLEFGLDTDSDRYDSSKAEEIATSTDGCSYSKSKEKEKSVQFKSGYMDKIQFESNKPISDPSKYSVAILQDGELHVTPLNAILQMRPSYTYFDKQDKRLKEEENEKIDVDDEACSSQKDVKQVTVSFARTESDRLKKAREKSYGYLTKKSSEEPWCDSVWWHSNSDEAELERSKLFTSATSDDDSRLNIPAKQYLSMLVPNDLDTANINSEGDDVLNLNDLKRLSLNDQCKVILKEAKLVTVGWISALTGVTGAPLLTALAGAGRLLRGGRWAARSSLLYPPGSTSQHSGISDQLMCRARDYVLYLFTQSQYVDRRKVTAAVKLPPEEVKEILSSVAVYQPEKGWELFIPPDPEFENKYPDVEQRQAHFWDARQRQFNEMLSCEQVNVKRQRKKSQRDSCSSDGGMPSPKLRSNSVGNYSQNSDNESGSETKKNKKNAFVGGGSNCKRTKQHSGNFNNFNWEDDRVS